MLPFVWRRVVWLRMKAGRDGNLAFYDFRHETNQPSTALLLQLSCMGIGQYAAHVRRSSSSLRLIFGLAPALPLTFKRSTEK
jgi:hypothetical protein